MRRRASATDGALVGAAGARHRHRHPADKLEAVFEPFVQVDARAARARSEGTGLGLAISRDLARGMGGELELESRVGEGSSFTILLRRADAAPSLTDHPLQASPP